MIVKAYQIGRATVLVDDRYIKTGAELEETLKKAQMKRPCVADTTNSKKD